jgi:hypothetical protein
MNQIAYVTLALDYMLSEAKAKKKNRIFKQNKNVVESYD